MRRARPLRITRRRPSRGPRVDAAPHPPPRRPTGVTRRTRLITVARRAWLLPVLMIAFLTVGLPSWLVGEGRPAAPDGAAIFVKLCRERGGTLVTTPPSAAVPRVERNCVVHYAGTEYVMDAVTPHGWDGESARLQQSGCEDADRQGSIVPRNLRTRFVYHPTTGVCERGR